MDEKARYVIEGRLRSAEDVNLAEVDLAVHAFVGGMEVGAAPVDKSGAYKLTFEGAKVPPSVELRLVPAWLHDKAVEFPGLVEVVSPLRFTPAAQGAAHHATMDIYVSRQVVIDLHRATRTYRIHGTVYASFLCYPPSGGLPTPPVILKKPLPAARLDFYEVNELRVPQIGRPVPLTERYLGTAFTAPDGGYDFKFDSTTNIWTAILFGDGKPDIEVRISQFRDGAWSQVYESTTDWDISEDFVKNYLIPLEDAYIPPGGKALPSGFRPIALGLLPLDTSRIVDGYATSGLGDPIALSHQPFCYTLRIFGLFGTLDNVLRYKVQVTPSTKDSATDAWVSATGEWEDVMDPLNNQHWDDTERRWDWRALGPDPVTHIYTSIDLEPEADWFEHALKVTWNSANKPDGYYLLKIIPCDLQGNPMLDAQGKRIEYPLPVLRVDNTLPEVALAVKSPTPTECGALTLPTDRKLTFSVTAYSAAGHILWYTLNGERGLHDESAGVTLERTREGKPTWTGAFDQDEVFTVAPRTNSCPAMAYNFELLVQGSATNCYASELESRRVWRETNLIVQE